MNSLSPTAADEIKTGAVVRSEKIERACSIATAIRNQRRQQQEALEGKLLANERGLNELRKMVDNWKGEKSLLEKLEAVVLMKEKECENTRKLVAETFNRWGIQKQASSRPRLMLQTHSSEHSIRLVPKVVVLMKEREKLRAEASIKCGRSASAKTKKHSGVKRLVAPSA